MKKFLFCSYPDFSDNALSLFRYMIREKINGEYIWLYSDAESINFVEFLYDENNNCDVKLIKKNTFVGMWHYLSANYIFTTHGMFEKFPILPWQKKINLWHGMPLKKIGALLSENVNMHMTYSISNGKIFDKYISNSFGLDDNQVLKVGSPRNDLLFQRRTFNFNSIFKDQNPVIAWLPTYRKTNIGVDREDGLYLKNSISGLTLDDFVLLNETLVKIKKNILIKLHPMDILNDNIFLLENINSFSNIKISSKKNDLFPHRLLYQLLQNTDSLITDYSSIYFDYLLLDKPIGLFIHDLDNYSKSRGIIDEVKEQYSGFKISDIDSFLEFLNMDSERRLIEIVKLKKVKKVFQSYDKSGYNCKEMLKLLDIK